MSTLTLSFSAKWKLHIATMYATLVKKISQWKANGIRVLLIWMSARIQYTEKNTK